MMTAKDALWRRYYEAVRLGKKEEAQMILRQLHATPNRKPGTGGCSRCRKRF
jgi:hypothetical protein